MSQPVIKPVQVHRKFLFPTILPYNRAWLRPDIIGGVTTAAVVVPVSMAYASLANLPPQTGLYTALVALPLYAMFGTSMILSTSVTSTICLLTADAVARVVSGNDPAALMQGAATLALMTGIVLLLAGLLRLGFIANFISRPVLTGMKVGLGLWIITGQLGKLLGIPLVNENVFSNIAQVAREIGNTSIPTLALSVVTILILVLVARYLPKIPGALVAVVFGIVTQVLLNLDTRGVVSVGTIPRGLPPISPPNLSYAAGLWPAAVGIALMSAIESIATARTFARPDDPRINTDREWIALGVANLGAAFVPGLPSGGGTTQSVVNLRAGGRTQLSQIVAALVVILALTALAPVFSLMPAATLGAIVFYSASGLIKPMEIARIAEVERRDAILALVSFVSVVFLGTLEAILVATLLSMLVLIFEANSRRVDVLGRKPGTDVFRSNEQNPQDELVDGLLIVRPEGGLYFANIDHVYENILDLIGAAPSPVSVVLIDGSAVPEIEYTALELLAQLVQELDRRGIELWVAALNPRPLGLIRRRLAQNGKSQEHSFLSVEDAVNAYLANANKNSIPPAIVPLPEN